mmetsp:Transcript_43434/g.85033  ORF Transcript_43434/g.85033 Transcript_43434/m.85033 type:complete len:247 (+) Transcript_43434:83-823(+)|eukprot:CAMPEP_0175143078 /NCGR_PEP_ID=MMETSP0087-20121206/13209_1 /TAXON_ID=136419 /ORGANISM="Unknown Unknown, Strain D1" /LENGTH=246 /DNA_ID=CAMNT_0016427061 /DNA_START=80 /DNA_END=820 /DNA_ORIENTATION=+
MASTLVRRVNAFWFRDLKKLHPVPPSCTQLWFARNPAVDRYIKKAFEPDLIRLKQQLLQELEGNAEKGEYSQLKETPEGALALVLLQSVFQRRMYRVDNPNDMRRVLSISPAIPDRSETIGLELSEHTRMLAWYAIQEDYEEDMNPVMASFFTLPLIWAESRTSIDTAIMKIERLLMFSSFCYRDYFTGLLEYARAHDAVIKKYNRYPSRNPDLPRRNTPEEDIYFSLFQPHVKAYEAECKRTKPV